MSTPSIKCANIEDLFSHVLIDTISDYHNGLFLRDIPHVIKVYFQRCLTQHIPDFFTHYTIEPSTCVGDIAGIGTNPRTYATKVPLQVRNSSNPTLPDANKVFDHLLLRTGPTTSGNGLNSIVSTLANFFLEDFLMSKPDATGSELADTVRGVFLGGVYGVTPQRAALLRAGVNGKLRTSITEQGDEVALMWKDVTSRPAILPGTFVLGLDKMNRHWGHIFWISAFTKIHNHFCDLLLMESSSFSDKEIFDRARLAVNSIQFRIIFEDYISNTLANGYLKDQIRWKFDPLQDCSGEFRSTNKHLIELNHIYRWHNMVPSAFDYGNGDFVTLKEFSASSNFTEYSLQAHFDALYRTKAGIFSTNNIPEELRHATVQTILAERRIGMASFNDYLEGYGMNRLKSFEELTLHADSAAEFAKLYQSIDDVELIVGVTVKPGHAMSKEMLVMLSAAVFSELYSDNHFCAIDKSYFSKEFLGDSLYHIACELDRPFATMLSEFFGYNITADTTYTTYTKETAQLDDVPDIWDIHFHNFNDYTGLNMLWESIVPDSTFYPSFLTALITAFAIVGTFGWLGRQFMLYSHKQHKKNMTDVANDVILVDNNSNGLELIREETLGSAVSHSSEDSACDSITHNTAPKAAAVSDSNKRLSPSVNCDTNPMHVLHEHDIILFNILTAIIYAIQMPGYCLGVGLLLFTSRFDIMAKSIWPYCITSLCVHMIMYVADIVIRFKHHKFNNFIFFHHLAYIATVLVALWQKDIFSLKFVTLMDASLTCEFGLYALMAYSKLHQRKLTRFWRDFGRWSVVFFVITRVIQTVLLGIYFVNGYHRMKKYELLGLYGFDCVMAILITLVQVYTVHEYSKWKTLWSAVSSSDKPTPTTTNVSNDNNISNDGDVSVSYSMTIDL